MPLELALHLPIAPEEQREQEAIREDPRRRIREAHRVESEHRNQRQRHKSARDHLENSRENRDLGESHALYQEPHDIHERELGLDIKETQINQLGRAKQVKVNKENTIIVDGCGVMRYWTRSA